MKVLLKKLNLVALSFMLINIVSCSDKNDVVESIVSNTDTKVSNAQESITEVQNCKIFFTFEDAVAISNCAANAKYISYQDHGVYGEYEFQINEVLYGYIPEKTIYLFESDVDTVDYNYTFGKNMYTPGDEYILIMERDDSLFYDNPRYVLVTDDIYIPLKNVNKSIMHAEQIAEIVENRDSIDTSTLIKNIRKQNNSEFKNYEHKDTKYSKSDKLLDIVTEADLVLELKIDWLDIEGIFANVNTYNCTVVKVLKGETVERGYDGKIWVTLFKNSVEIGERYVIMLSKIGEDSTIYVQSSKKSIISANDSKTINEIKQIIDQKN